MSADKPSLTTLAPSFLVSVPQMRDPHFNHSVVYLIAHNKTGAFGITINRPGKLSLSEVCKELGIAPVLGDPVYNGGPVEPERGFVLHGGGQALDGAETIEPGIHISGLPETLQKLCGGDIRFRLFLGYAGWGPGQLENEISGGAWLSIPSAPRYIFDTAAEAIWERVLRDAGIDPGAIFTPNQNSVN
jgi:putative transcriptional regulator